jgi:hypothetical protein
LPLVEATGDVCDYVLEVPNFCTVNIWYGEDCSGDPDCSFSFSAFIVVERSQDCKVRAYIWAPYGGGYPCGEPHGPFAAYDFYPFESDDQDPANLTCDCYAEFSVANKYTACPDRGVDWDTQGYGGTATWSPC